MADTKMFQVSKDFDLRKMVENLKKTYEAKGFIVSTNAIGTTGVSINFSKDDDGIKKYLGLAQVITANITVNENGAMIVNFQDAEWIGKILCFAVGWFLCLVPLFIACFGAYNQLELPKSIGKDIQMLIAGGPIPF